jgi:hypothetical protein
LVITLVAYASVTGPEARYTNAPGDIGTCTNCHDTFENPNVGPGSVTIQGNPAVYEPGQSYTLSVTVRQAVQRFGFQMTVIDSGGNRAGTLEPLGPETQINSQTGLGGRQYIQHTQQGTVPTTQGQRVWQIRWIAPSTDIGTVRFYAAGNAANGNGTNQGDYIYTTSAVSDSPTSVVTVRFVSAPDGQTLQAGSKFTINWSATGGSNVAGYELRYSTDDGATFPITNLIFSTTDSNVTSHEWTVPNVSTTEARIRVQASTQAGGVVTSLSGRFTIVGGPGVPLPRIFNASVSGKKLIVSGENFQFDADLLMDGQKQKKTSNDETNPTTMLIAKKSGKKIARGQTVKLQVRNPDGTLSAEFSYTRPLE